MPSLAAPGCLTYHPYTDPNDPSHMVLVEEWTTAEAFDEHFTTPHFFHVRDVLDQILAEPMIIKRLVSA
ncbi:putative quinol monooxygenase [Nocardia pseudovaccinii]|uniref:putative quinol monooxygenase n=1 Tax=Nocardia pseudovaccinii TaxID=189540 RepID=UPI003D91C4C8